MQTGQEHPLPPEDLNDRQIKIDTLDTETRLFRIHRTVFNPIFFGRDLPHRFDAPRPYGVVYAGMNEGVAFLEVMRDQANRGWIERSSLAAESISQLKFDRPLRLIRASGANLERMGANSGIFATKNRQITQQWSFAFWQYPENVDGIIYPSCHNNEQFCVALYSDRVDGILATESTVEILSDIFSDKLTEITEKYGYMLFS